VQHMAARRHAGAGTRAHHRPQHVALRRLPAPAQGALLRSPPMAHWPGHQDASARHHDHGHQVRDHTR